MNVLLVVGDAGALTTQDLAVKDRLETTLAHTVTVRDDAEAVPAALVQTYRAVVVAGSCVSANLGTKYRDCAVPMLWMGSTTSEAALWTTSAAVAPSGVSAETVRTTWHLQATYVGHTLAAGKFDGLHVVYSTPTAHMIYVSNTPAAGAQTVWRSNGNTTWYHVVYGFERGVIMSGAIMAAARRVVFGPQHPELMNATGWSVFDASVAWLVVDSAPPTTPVLANPGNSFAPVTLNWAASTWTGGAFTYSGEYYDGVVWLPLFSGLAATTYEWDTEIRGATSVRVRAVPTDGRAASDWATVEFELSSTFLVLDDVAVEVTDFDRLLDDKGGPGLRRAINGQLRNSVDWRKRGWDVTAYTPDDVEAEALRALLADGGAVVVARGDALGGTFNVRCATTGDNYRMERKTWWRMISFTMREV